MVINWEVKVHYTLHASRPDGVEVPKQNTEEKLWKVLGEEVGTELVQH